MNFVPSRHYNIGITVHPTVSLPKILPKPKPKSKFKFPRRINMLASPKWPRNKYEPPGPPKEKSPIKLDAELQFRNDHLCRNQFRVVDENNKLFKHIFTPRFHKHMEKHLDRAWTSIYMYYKKQRKDKRNRKLKRLQEKKRGKKPLKTPQQIEEERLSYNMSLARPKKIWLPDTILRKKMRLEDLQGGIDKLAEPKMMRGITQRSLPIRVSSKARTYEITEAVLKLAELPRRLRKQVSEMVYLPGNVHPNARYAKCTPRIDELAKPSLSAREAKKNEDDKYDPFTISKTALKYKATARILELAKPLERK